MSNVSNGASQGLSIWLTKILTGSPSSWESSQKFSNEEPWNFPSSSETLISLKSWTHGFQSVSLVMKGKRYILRGSAATLAATLIALALAALTAWNEKLLSTYFWFMMRSTRTCWNAHCACPPRNARCTHTQIHIGCNAHCNALCTHTQIPWCASIIVW